MSRQRHGGRSHRRSLIAIVAALALIALPLMARATSSAIATASAATTRTAPAPAATAAAAVLVSGCDAKVLTAAGRAGAALSVRAQDGSTTQQWRVAPATVRGFSVLVSGSGGVAAVAGRSTAVGTSVVSANRGSSTSQQWRVTRAADGSMTFHTRRAAGRVLGLQHGRARLVAANGSCSTRWRLTPVPAAATPGAPSTPNPSVAASPSPSASPPSVTAASGATTSAGGTLVNPMPGMGGLAATLAIPKGSAGSGEMRVGPSPNPPPPGPFDIGAFRVSCDYSHMGFDDPIVKPGRPGASHLHTFFGNTATTASSTPDSIATSGNSTCHGGIANRSAYWVPTLYDTRTGQPIAPTFAIMYYKTGYDGVKPEDVQPLPPRLRMIAGSATASAPQSHMDWGCLEGGSGSDPGGGIPADCGVADQSVQMSVEFPQCWNGKDLDSPDHKSHMAYATAPAGCPAGHPVALPVITINVRYAVHTLGESRFWRLSSDTYDTSKPGGLSIHGDWMNGWDEDVMKTWLVHCDRARMSSSYQLCDGRELL